MWKRVIIVLENANVTEAFEILDCEISFSLPQFSSLRGHAVYATAVDVYPNDTGVGATYFMTYHTILKESPDFTDALKMARALATNISQTIGHKVFAYRCVLLGLPRDNLLSLHK